jgi:hypothetical protein
VGIGVVVGGRFDWVLVLLMVRVFDSESLGVRVTFSLLVGDGEAEVDNSSVSVIVNVAVTLSDALASTVLETVFDTEDEADVVRDSLRESISDAVGVIGQVTEGLGERELEELVVGLTDSVPLGVDDAVNVRDKDVGKLVDSLIERLLLNEDVLDIDLRTVRVGLREFDGVAEVLSVVEGVLEPLTDSVLLSTTLMESDAEGATEEVDDIESEPVGDSDAEIETEELIDVSSLSECVPDSSFVKER